MEMTLHHMTFEDLINRHTWPGVKYRFLETYPDEADCIDAYADVYERLILLTPVETSMRLSVTEKVGDDGRIWGDVSGLDGTRWKDQDENSRMPGLAGEDEVSWAIEFCPWEEWLGMEIDPETLQQLDEVDILVHCLWEMTFCGFEQETIQQEYKQILDAWESVKNSDFST